MGVDGKTCGAFALTWLRCVWCFTHNPHTRGGKREPGGESLAEVAVGKTSVFHTQREGDTKDKPQAQAENKNGTFSSGVVRIHRQL